MRIISTTVKNKAEVIKVKAIIVDALFKTMSNLIKTKSLSSIFVKTPSMSIKGANKIHIFCHSIEDKKSIISCLSEKKSVFHTFAEPSDKSIRKS
jgi:hypothetical protein